MVTLGVAVEVPEPWGSQLQDYRQAVGDASAALIPTHVTLVPPVTVDDAELEAVVDHLACAAGQVETFEVHLRGTGTFRPVTDVVFVALAEGIGPVEQLAEACRQGPLALDLAFPFHPHVTIAHDQPDEVLDRAFEELAEFECRFAVE